MLPAWVLSIGELYDNVAQQLCLWLKFFPFPTLNSHSIVFLVISWVAISGPAFFLLLVFTETRLINRVYIDMHNIIRSGTRAEID